MRRFLYFLSFAFIVVAPVAHADEPYSVKHWALDSVLQRASLSPDGERLALLKVSHAGADPVLEIYDAGNLEAEPFRVNADPMRIVGARWVADDSMVISLRQKVRSDIEGFNQGVFEQRIALLEVDEQKMTQFRETNARIENVLPSDPDAIIISFSPDGAGKNRIDPRFRPRSYYELDLESGSKRLLLRGQSSLGQVSFDGEGNPRIARGFDLSDGEFIWYYSDPEEEDWKEIYRLSEDSFERFSIAGLHPNKEDTLLVVANNGRDRTALWEFDPETGSFGEMVFDHDEVDIRGVASHSMSWTKPDTVVGVRYATDRSQTAYFDEEEAAVERQLRELVPHSHNVSIVSRSRDGQSLVVFNIGPRDPGTFYLLKDGMFSKLGSRNPLLEPEKLADVEYISYEARDGRRIPAFITVPQGEPPFPLVVVPHGGPFVSEVVSFDTWGQMLANHGYMVLQPQYRGSRNFGLEFYKSAFVDGGQGGKKMQDDLDDGALHLVEQGMAAADRLAMFGWSYGGYAALVAAARSPQIYQCAVAGAGVSDNLLQVNYYRDRLRGAQREEQLGMWIESVSPIEHAGDVNIPLLIIHGSVDQRVPVDHSNRYRKALERSGKSYEYVELEGADHFSNTLTYDHKVKFFSELLEFLDNDCGPGGL